MTDLELPYNNYLYECMPLMSCKPIYSVCITIYKNDMQGCRPPKEPGIILPGTGGPGDGSPQRDPGA